MQVLTIQSSVAYGHAGNSSATFCLQRLGHEAWSVSTVCFSNHTGHGSWRGPVLDADDVADVIRGIEELGVLASCDLVLSGYQGAESIGEVILDAVARVKAANANATYCCDPVMGDVGRGFFVREGIPDYMRDHVVPAADLVTPNLFELEFLVGAKSGSLRTDEQVRDAARAAIDMGPSVVLVTSVITDDTPEDTIGMMAVTNDRAWTVSTPKLPISVNGAGDATAALFAVQVPDWGVVGALERTAGSIYGVFKATHEMRRREIALIPAQEQLTDPSLVVSATQMT